MKKKHIEKIVDMYINKTLKDCYAIDIILNETPELTDNKLGGYPYLPVGEEYPLDSDGNPMALLLQINLSGLNLPCPNSNKILEIFTTSELDWPSESKVLLFDAGLEYQTVFPEIDFSEAIIPECFKIDIELDKTPMPVTNNEADEILCEIIQEVTGEKPHHSWNYEDDDLFDALFDIHNPSAVLGGYPDFTQDDCRPDDGTRDYCLFKLDSNLHPSIDLGDCGILTVTMPYVDMLIGKFNNCVMDWDCC